MILAGIHGGKSKLVGGVRLSSSWRCISCSSDAKLGQRHSCPLSRLAVCSTTTTNSSIPSAQQQFLMLWRRWRPCHSSIASTVGSLSNQRPFCSHPVHHSMQSSTSARWRLYSTSRTTTLPPPPSPPAAAAAAATSSKMASNSIPEWTCEMNSHLIQWRKEGVSWRDIGKRLGKSSVGCMKHHRNLIVPALDPVYGWNAHKDGLILHRRLVLGHSWPQISQSVGPDHPPMVCMARFKIVLEPVLAKSPGAEPLEQSDILQAVMREWQWRPSELARWYQHRVEVVGFVNVRLPEEMRWTEAMESRLWAMRQRGDDWSRVANELEMSEEACLRRFKLRFLDKVVDPPPLFSSGGGGGVVVDQAMSVGRPSKAIWTTRLDDQLIRLRRLGLAWREIGSRLRISYVACRKRYEATLWPEATQYWNKERSAVLAQHVQQGKNASEIAKAMGDNVHPMAVDRQIKVLLREERRQRLQQEQLALRRRRALDRVSKVLLGDDDVTHGPLSPAPLEQFYTEQDWDRLLGSSELALIEAGKSREERKEAWRQQFGMWTIEQETTLIQQVLQQGLGSGEDDHWRNISAAVGGGHSPEECQIRWKNLDLPVKQTATVPADWSLEREQAFWRLWRDQQETDDKKKNKIQWDEIAQALGHSVTAEECERYFASMTSPLWSKSAPKHLAQKLYAERLDRLSASMVRQGGVLFWTKPRSTRLQTLARILYGPRWWKRRRLLWRRVARHMGPGVTRLQCHQHWAYLKPAHRAPWSQDEIKLVEQGVRTYGEDWSMIRQMLLPHRTVGAIRRQWFILSDHGAKVTVEEYMTLMTSIQAFRKEIKGKVKDEEDEEKQEEGGRENPRDRSKINWVHVASQLPGWTRAPCRRVWEASYVSRLENTIFLEEEDDWLVANVDPSAPQDWEGVSQQLDSTISPWLYRLRWCQLMMPQPSAPST